MVHQRLSTARGARRRCSGDAPVRAAPRPSRNAFPVRVLGRADLLDLCGDGGSCTRTTNAQPVTMAVLDGPRGADRDAPRPGSEHGLGYSHGCARAWPAPGSSAGLGFPLVFHVRLRAGCPGAQLSRPWPRATAPMALAHALLKRGIRVLEPAASVHLARNTTQPSRRKPRRRQRSAREIAQTSPPR